MPIRHTRIVRATHGFGISGHFFNGFRLERQVREALLFRFACLRNEDHASIARFYCRRRTKLVSGP